MKKPLSHFCDPRMEFHDVAGVTVIKTIEVYKLEGEGVKSNPTETDTQTQ